MKRLGKFSMTPAILLLAMSLAPALFAEQSGTTKSTRPEVVQKTKGLHIPFIANKGQVNKRVKFYASTFGGTVFVTKDGQIVYSLPIFSGGTEIIHEDPKGNDQKRRANDGVHDEKTRRGVVIKEKFVGGNIINTTIAGEGKAITNVNYFKGGDPSRWKTHVPTYNMVSLGDVYQGIELKLKAYGNNIEKLFFVKPYANPEKIKISLRGAKTLRVNAEGQLDVETDLGSVQFTKPLAYQEIEGKRVEIAVEYQIQKAERRRKSLKSKNRNSNPEIENVYGFKVANYDKKRDLIIDPFLASTYLGGSDSDSGYSVAIDPGGNVYVTGNTWSSDFPATNTYGTSYNTIYEGSVDAFISKLNEDLTSLLASTYLGGSDFDSSNSLAIDSGGNIYVAGNTFSTDFPVSGSPYDTSPNGSDDAFVSKLNGDLTSLLASTYLGGTDSDSINSLAIDSGGNIYAGGGTWSSDFPTTTIPLAYDGVLGGTIDAFVSKLNGNLTSLLASTYLGGTDFENVSSLAVGSGGNIYVTGDTGSSDFPTTTIPLAYDAALNGFSDVFVSKLNGDLTGILASTYVGGSGTDYGYSIAIGSGGNIYLAGETGSSDFPTNNTSGISYDTTINDDIDAFVSKLNGDLSNLLASTYLGGDFWEYCSSLAIDSDGNIYVAGGTASSTFPTTPGAHDSTYNGVIGSGDIDTFVSKLRGDLTALLTSTYLGGSDYDPGYSIALDTGGNIYVAGETLSSNFPTTNGAYDRNYNESEIFVSKFDFNPPTVSATNPANNATGVAVVSNLTATFSEAMAPATINDTTFTVNGVAGAVSLSADGLTATFNPNVDLANSTLYTATITTGAKDLNNNAMTANFVWSFTTAAAQDTTPPTVSSTNPANNATGVAVTSNLTATFSEAMAPATINNTTFTVNGVAGAVSLSADGLTATFNPNVDLANSTLYTATITTGAKDANNNAIAANFVWSFTTAATQDTTPPTVSSTNPANNATGVAVASNLTATFSEAMAPATINNTTFTVNGVAGAVSLSADGLTATFNPNVDLANSTLYTATITTGAKDLNNNAIAANFVWSFTTAATGPISGQQAFYAFDEGSGTIANDSSGNGNNGNIIGATWTTGKNGGGLGFDGNDYVSRTTPSAGLKPSLEVATVAWIKTSATDTGGSEIVSMGDSYALRVRTNGNIQFFYYTGTVWRSIITTGVNVRDGVWHHIVGQKSSTALQIYVDGISRASIPNTGPIAYTQGTGLFIGKHGNGETIYDFVGAIDDVRIYNRALSALEVSNLYTPGPDTTPPTVSSTNPANNATGVAVTSNLTATFSEAMAPATINNTTFTVNGVAGAVSLSADGLTATFNPNVDLANSTLYTATITTGAKDLNNNAIAANFVWSFTTAATGPISGQQAFYAFDEGSGTIANDSSGNGNNGNIIGATWTTGKNGGGLGFDGNDYVSRTTPSAGLKPSLEVATVAWIKTSATDTGGAEIVSMGDSYAMRVRTNGNIQFFYYTGTTWRGIITTGVNVRDGVWHHIVGQKSSTALQIYVDGISRASTPTTGTIAYTLGTGLSIGRHGNGETIYDFVGAIDDVRIYNRALSAQEVSNLYTP